MGLFTSATEKELEEREAAVAAKEADLAQRERLLDHRNQAIAAQEVAHATRARELLDQELALRGLEEAEKTHFAEAQRIAFKEMFDARAAELDRRAEEASKAQTALTEKAVVLESRDAEVSRRERDVAQREVAAEAGFPEQTRKAAEQIRTRLTDLQKYSEKLKEWEARLRQQNEAVTKERAAQAEHERALVQREMEAQAGFGEQNRQALVDLEARREEVSAKTRQLEVELTRVRAARLAALDLEIDQEAATRREATSQSLRREREAAEAELQKQLQARAADIVARETSLGEQRIRLQAEQAALDTRAAEVHGKALDLEARQAILTEDQRAVEKRVEERIAIYQENHERQKRELRAVIDALQRECQAQERRLGAFEDLHRRLGNEPPESILDQRRANLARIAGLEDEVARRPGEEIKVRLEVAVKERDSLAQERERLQRELIELSSGKVHWHATVHEVEEQRRYREIAERRAETLQTLNQVLRDQLDRLQRIYEKPKEHQERIGVIEEPYLTRNDCDGGAPSEEQWLTEIHAGCVASGLVFPKRLMYAFHTALKAADWAPLTVLAGVSGTGKSELPRLYSRFGGINFLSLPVQPNWDSPQSLLGFYNSVDNRFNATPLLQALVQSQRSPDAADGLADQLLIVLLDEMNLAHVELYFSDLLSKLELRRGQAEGPGASEGERLEVDLGAGFKKYTIPLGRNVLWTGTMNEDETTKSLSDKVLDRGNVILFPRPRELQRRQRLELAPSRSRQLPREVWKSWLRTETPFTTEQVQPFKATVETINRSLERVGRALGHRVWQSIESYLANYPAVVAAEGRSAEDLERGMRTAFEDQLVQKVMPKLRGIETSGKARTECLEPIRHVIEERALALSADFDLACNAGFGGFVWKSAKYLEAGE